ncbi:MAG: carboxymuconolactone decarboxylase family protein [Actinomycetia bacterium]|nr:carboxymuconolactone decarboxylase family protein [Actinomycetes bacterium]
MSDEPRIPMLGIDESVAAGADVGLEDATARLSVFRLLMNQPDVAKWLRDLIMGLLWRSSFDARLRELIIMRLGWSTGSVYEWTQHWGIATDWLEVDPEDVLAVRDWRASDRFGPTERAVLAAVDDVVEHGHVSESVFEECRAHISSDPAVLVEFVSTIGTWRMVSTLLKSFDVPLDEGLMPWPPDGTEPDDWKVGTDD